MFKLAALQNEQGQWDYKVKLSEQLIKVSTPGILQVRRFFDKGTLVGDMLYSEDQTIAQPATMVHPNDPTQHKSFKETCTHEDLLVPIFKQGKLVYTSPTLQDVQARTKQQVESLHETYRRLLNPHIYKVGLEQQLHQKKMDVIVDLRSRAE